MFYKRPLFERRVNRDTQKTIKDLLHTYRIKTPSFEGVIYLFG